MIEIAASNSSERKTQTSAGVQAPRFPVLTLQDAQAARIWHRQRVPVGVETVRGQGPLVAQLGGPVGLERFSKLHLQIAGQPCILIVPDRLIGAVWRALDVPLSAKLPAESASALVEYMFSPALDALEEHINDSVRVALIEPASADVWYGSFLNFTLKFLGQTYPLRFQAPDNLMHQLALVLQRSSTAPIFQKTPIISVAFRLGSTVLNLRALRQLRLNDAVLFDVTCGHQSAMVVFGEKYAACATRNAQQITLTERPYKLSILEEHEYWSMSELSATSADPVLEQPEFEDIPIKLLFDVGRQEISIGELRGLAPGYIFELHRKPETAVEIYAGGTRIGQGELVQINETLGVRVVRLFNHE